MRRSGASTLVADESPFDRNGARRA